MDRDEAEIKSERKKENTTYFIYSDWHNGTEVTIQYFVKSFWKTFLSGGEKSLPRVTTSAGSQLLHRVW